jgi:monoamine oxidase
MSLYRALNRRFGPLASLSREQLLHSRRDALKLALAASAGLLLCDRSSAGIPRPGKPGRVVVIGAGLAGLACAHELKAAGHEVTVIEARSRVGGRVISFREIIPGKFVEGGGEFIGSNHAVWARYAGRFGLEMLDVPDEKELDHPLRLKGRTLEHAEAKGVWERMHAAIATLTDRARDVDADRPWLTERASTLDHETLEAWLGELGLDELTGAAVRSELEGLNGVALKRSSLLGMLAIIKAGGFEKYWTDSEAFRCKGGSQQLAERLAAGLGRESLVLRAPVVSISMTDQGCVVRRQDGNNHECDLAVLATPPTMWRRLIWEPTLLPPEFNMQMGQATKHLARLRESVWKNAGHSQYAATDRAISRTWDATTGQKVDGAGSNAATAAKEDAVCLTGFSGGPAVEEFRGLNPGERVIELNAQLEQVHPGTLAAFQTSRFMDWPGESWTFGGYSFPEPGQICRSGPAIEKGFGRVRFCGEHMCYGFAGYMEGALRSGVDLAAKLDAELRS